MANRLGCGLDGNTMNPKLQLINLMAHVIQNTEYTPKWNYMKEPFLEADTLHDLPYRYPLLLGIRSANIHALYHKMIHTEAYNLHGMLIVKDGKVIFEKYVPPYKKTYRHVSYSMCKSVVGMAIGLAVDDGKLTLNTHLADIFPEYIGVKASKELKSLTIYHLLTMQAGICFHELSQAFCKDWVKGYLKADFAFFPGEQFYYNSLNSYILCAVLQRVYNKDVMQLITERLLKPLEIHDITWDSCPKGIIKGGYGMKLSLHDMAKLGLLYLNHGVHIDSQTGHAHRLLSPQYIDQAVSVQRTTDNEGFDYGYHCWVMPDGYLFNGMLGQNVYVFPEQKLVIATQAGSSCFLPTKEMMEDIRAFVYDRKIQPEKTDKHTPANMYNYGRQLQSIWEKTYSLEEGLPSLMPFFMQLFYQQITQNIDKIRFYPKYPSSAYDAGSGGRRKSKRFLVELISEKETVILEASCGRSIEQHVLINGQRYPVSVSCYITTPDASQTSADISFEMQLRIDFLEEANSRIYYFSWEDERLHAKAEEIPTLDYLTHSLLEKDVMAASKTHLPKYIPSNIQNKLNKMIKPDTYGFENS